MHQFPRVYQGHQPQFWVISIVYLLMALLYGAFIPLFEAPDEHKHYFTAQWIADNGRLPYVPATEAEEIATGLERDWTGQEAAQPPLYYLLASLVIAPFDTSQARELTEPNPFVQLGDASSPQNLNAFVHSDIEAWPWTGHVLAAHILRGISAVIGWGTLFLIYSAALTLWPNTPGRALWAMGFVAFLPQFIVQHAAVSNDVLITFIVTAVLLALLRVESSDAELSAPSKPIPMWIDIALGIGIGLAALTKNQGIGLLVFVVGTIVIRHLGRTAWPTILRRTTTILITTVLVAGWLWVRNWQLYGDITAVNQFVLIAGGDRGYTLAQALAEWSGLWLSLIAVFGWFNILPPLWIHTVWTILILVAVAFALFRYASSLKVEWSIIGLWRWFRTWPILLFGWVLAVILGLISFLLQTPAAQGRLLFPAFLPLGLLIGYGLDAIPKTDRLLQLRRGLSVFIPLVLIQIYLLIGVILPTYTLPVRINEASIPDQALRLNLDLGEGIELVAVDITPEPIQLGDTIPLTLYWRKTAPQSQEERLQVVFDVFGRDLEPIGKLQTYHGGGLYPADLWPEDGQIVVDRLEIPTFDDLDPAGQTPVDGRIWVKLVDVDETADIGGVKVVPNSWPGLAGQSLATIGDGVQILEVTLVSGDLRPGEDVEIAVEWQVLTDVYRDFTTFLHFGEAGTGPVSTGDSPPLGGDYPTRHWRSGERFTDHYSLSIPSELPAGEYRLTLGMYDPADPGLARLPLTIDGIRQPEDALIIQKLVIE